MKQIINSILDNDLYTMSVQNAILDSFPDAVAEYRFVNRGAHKITPELLKSVQEQIREVFPTLALSQDEYKWLKNKCPYLKRWYFEYLNNYRFNPNEVKIAQLDENSVQVIGPWHSTIMWEVPLLAVFSQLYFEMVDTNWNMNGQVERINEKGRILSDNVCHVSDMSTRRRRNFATQEMVVKELKKYDYFLGTSNPYLAMRHDVKPMGTMSHQWPMAMQALRGIRNCNRHAMHYWTRTFGTTLGVMLTDTVTTDCFLKDFNPTFANLFRAVRCDSGDECRYADKIVAHYRKIGIDPMSKSIVFSNSLNVDKAIKIRRYCEGKINATFGMGNFLGNHFDNSPAPNMVIKLWSIDGIPVAKLSDDVGKVTGDKDAVRVTKWECCGTPLD